MSPGRQVAAGHGDEVLPQADADELILLGQGPWAWRKPLPPSERATFGRGRRRPVLAGRLIPGSHVPWAANAGQKLKGVD